MTDLKIAVRKQPAEYEPGEEIAGGVQWQLKKPPQSVQVRLLWHTSGRGYQDVGVAATVQFDDPQQDDTRSFKFTAPEAPYSYRGPLITLGWAVELVALPHNESAREELVIAPEGKTVEMMAA
jgi:hypothetical protein